MKKPKLYFLCEYNTVIYQINSVSNSAGQPSKTFAFTNPCCIELELLTIQPTNSGGDWRNKIRCAREHKIFICIWRWWISRFLSFQICIKRFRSHSMWTLGGIFAWSLAQFALPIKINRFGDRRIGLSFEHWREVTYR